jgi:hypothetical protein
MSNVCQIVAITKHDILSLSGEIQKKHIFQSNFVIIGAAIKKSLARISLLYIVHLYSVYFLQAG